MRFKRGLSVLLLSGLSVYGCMSEEEKTRRDMLSNEVGIPNDCREGKYRTTDHSRGERINYFDMLFIQINIIKVGVFLCLRKRQKEYQTYTILIKN